jgi:hypothetical protein
MTARACWSTFGAEKLAQGAPLKRLGDDDDLKGAVLLLASAAGKHITGQILAVDGGVSAATAAEPAMSKPEPPGRAGVSAAHSLRRELGLELWHFGDGKAELRWTWPRPTSTAGKWRTAAC